MSAVDDRIVAMKFENRQFESGIASTLTSLQKLKQGMDLGSVGTGVQKALGGISGMFSKFGLKNPFATATQGVSELQGNVNRFSTGTITGGITSINKGWVAMTTIAVTALSTVTNAALQQAGQLGKNLFGIQAVADGWSDYGLKINATQTIMAGTGKSIGYVSDQLKDLDIYADQTIYSLSDMTSNISKFTNAGVDLKTSVAALKGVAQVAAVSGANSNEAARAMYNLGQAIGQGHVKLMDWKSVELANMGTVEFKQQLIDTAVEMGTLTKAGDGLYKTLDGTEVTTKNFSTTLEKQWLTAEALTETLGRYSDKTTEIGKKAYKAATEVKTMSMMFETLSAAAGTGWTDSFEILVGNLPQATKMWTAATDAIGGVIGQSADARNKILKDWAEFGGRSAAIKSIANIWEALGNVLGPIKDAFRDIFPAKSGKDLADLTKNFRDFTASLIPGEQTMENIRRTFAGVFAIFSIIGQVIGGVVSMFGRLFGAVGQGSGKFLDFTGGVGDFLVALDEMLRQSGLVEGFFKGLGSVLAVPLKLLAMVASALGRLFGGLDMGTVDAVEGGLGRVGDRLEPLARVGQTVERVFSKLGDAIGNALSGIGDAIAGSFSSGSFDKTLDAINTGLLAGILLLIRRFMTGGILNIDLGGGLFGEIAGTFSQLTDTLKSMQAQIKADILIKIAAALAILTASLVVLSMIDSKKLNGALQAMAFGFVGLQAAMSAMVALINGFGAAKLPFIAAGMIGISTAMLIMAGALKVMSTIKPAELARGLAGMAGMMLILTKAVKPLSANSKGLFTASAALIAVATALKIMASALKDFAEMDYETMVRGLAGAAGSLAVLAAAMAVMPTNITMQAGAILILSVALKVLASVVADFATMDYATMGRGLLGVAGALVAIAAGMKLMPQNMLVTAAALVVVGGALHIIHGVAMKFAAMSFDQMQKAAIALAGSLLIIAGGLHLMNGTLAGSAALVIAAGALTVLAPILITLGAMSWQSIIKGLVGLAGAFIIIGAAGLVLGPLVPALLGLGAAMVLIGGGFALAGAAALAFASAFGIFVAAGSAGIAVLSGLISVIIKSIPKVITAFAQGLIQMIKEIGKAAPAMVNSFTKILVSLLNAVIKAVPKMAQTFQVLVMAGLNTILRLAPAIFNAGLKLIVGFLQAIDSNIGKIVPLAVSIITKFIDGVANGLPRIIQSGVNLIIKFVNGIADAIRANSYAMGQAGGNLATAIVEGMVKGIAGGISAVTDAARNLAKSALNAAKDFLGIKSPSREFKKLGEFVDEGFVEGLKGGEEDVVGAMEDMSTRLKDVATEAAAHVETLKDKLKDLKNDKDPDNKAIAKIKKQIAAAKELEAASRKAYEQFMKGSKSERQEMAAHGKAYDALTEKIKEQKAEVERLTDARNAEAASITQNFSAEPDLTHESTGEEDPERSLTPEEYAAELAAKAAATEQFIADLATLRSMGMDDATYRKLLEEGLDAQPFVTQMIAGGADMVEAVDANTARLNAAAAQLGNMAANDMHNAGIQAAQGLVVGLEADQAALEQVMERLARKMMRAIRRALKIKSPSREFMSVGDYSVQGLAKGLTDNAKVAEKAAGRVGYAALDTLKTAMSGLEGELGKDTNFNPTVVPVLDLTQMAKDASKIGTIFDGNAINPTVSLDGVSALASERQAAKDALEATQPEVREIKVESHLHSPTPISAIDAFRNTKSGVSLMKEALNQ